MGAKLDFAHSRIKKHALHQAWYKRIKKYGSIRERERFEPRVTFSPSLCSGANVHTRIQSVSRTVSIEMYYFDTPCIKYYFFARLGFKACVKITLVSKNNVR